MGSNAATLEGETLTPFSSSDDDKHVDTELTRLPSSRTTGTEPAGSNVTLPDTSNRGAAEDCRWGKTGLHGGCVEGTVTC